MKFLRQSIMSLVLIGALASPAFAAGEGGKFEEGQLMMTTPSGAIVQRKIADMTMMDMMMKDAMPMTAGVMMMMHGGKMYHVQDKKMPDGKMLSEMMMTP